MLCVLVVVVGLVVRFRGSFRAGDGLRCPDAVLGRPSALIYTVWFSPARPTTVAVSRKLGVKVPWASLLCWSEQRQSCELERGSSSIADNPCLVTASTLSRPREATTRPTLFLMSSHTSNMLPAATCSTNSQTGDCRKTTRKTFRWASSLSHENAANQVLERGTRSMHGSLTNRHTPKD